jgi:hypothetical protein
MAGQSAASAAVAKLKKTAGKAWNAGRKAEGGGGQFPGVPGGNHLFQATSAKFDLDKNKNPYFLINLVIPSGPYKAKRGSKFYGFTETDNRTIEQCVASLARDLKCLGYSEEEIEVEALPQIAEEITEKKQKFHGKLQEPRNEGFDPVVYFNAPASEDESLEDETPAATTRSSRRAAPAPVEAEEEATEEETTEEETTEEEVNTDDQDFVPAVNQKYLVQFKGSRKQVAVTVKSVNVTKGTCTVKKEDGTLVKDIPFDAIGDDAE